MRLTWLDGKLQLFRVIVSTPSGEGAGGVRSADRLAAIDRADRNADYPDPDYQIFPLTSVKVSNLVFSVDDVSNTFCRKW